MATERRSAAEIEARSEEILHASRRVTVIQPNNSMQRLGIRQVWEHRYLLKHFVLRQIRGRYRPTTMGYGWILMRPALLCAVYFMVFGLLMHVRPQSVPYPLFLFLGVSVYLFFSSGVTDTTSSLIGNAGTMSKVYYPRLIVPLTAIFTNLMDLLACSVVIVALMFFYRVVPGWTALYVPLILTGMALITFSLGLILAAYAITVRDVMMILPVMMRVLIYMMPCVYPISLIPAKILPYYYLNPMASLMQWLRWSLFGDVAPPLWTVASIIALIVIGLFFGLLKFNRAERTMVDTL